MQFTDKLQQGILIRRYKRFLADIETEQSEFTIHCPNTGSMKNCQDPGSRVWFTDSNNPNRKYPCTWQVVEVNHQHLVGINTGIANTLVREAIESGVVKELAGYATIRSEVPYGEQKSRIDLLLEGGGTYQDVPCYVEIKNVSLGLQGGLGVFPDAVTTRGHKHLRELMHMKAEGARSVLMFCVQHEGIDLVKPADDIDAEYGRLLREASSKGVEILAYKADFDIENSAVQLTTSIPVELN